MIRLVAASLTDVGRIREENEDCIWSQVNSGTHKEPLGLFIVCDGMGGHMGGKYASYWAVEAIKQGFASLFSSNDPRATVVLTDEDIRKVKAGEVIVPRAPEEPILEELTFKAIQKANYVVYNYARQKPQSAGNAGTTVTMAVLRGSQVIIANMGDSRTYLLRNHELRLITRDHSLVATLILDGQILPNEIYTHPQRNVIYRYLGQKDEVQPDIYRYLMQPGDKLLLCSDGLWEMIRSEEDMKGILDKAGDPRQACRDLVDAAKRRGGEDNISVIVVKAI
jgi:serine/threonine protein phosphatase PrpC